MAIQESEQVVSPPSTDGQHPAARRMIKKRPVRVPMVIGMLAVVLILGFLWYRVHNANSNATPMVTATVTRGNLIETVEATGNVNPQTGAEINIGSQNSGTVTGLYADVGSMITAGELIAVISSPDLAANVGQAAANVAADRAKELQDQEGMSQTDVTAQMGVAQAKSVIAGDEAKLAQAKATLAQQKQETPNDISQAQANLAGEQAALQAAQATYQQTVQGADPNIAAAQQALASMQATAKNSSANLARQKTLLAQGYVAQSVVDQAQATADVDLANVSTAQQSLTLAQQKVAADLVTFRDAVTQAEHAVASDQAALRNAQAETNLIVVDQQNVNNAQATLLHDQQALKVAVANLANDPIKQAVIKQDADQVQAALQQQAYSQAVLDKSYIRSPIAGTVITLAIQQGETIAAGLNAPTLVTVCDLNRLQIDAFPDETDIAQVKVGQKANITVDAFPNRTFHGTVTKISAGATVQQGVITYDVTISISDKHHVLRPSMTADCKIITATQNNVLLVPAVALNMGVKSTTVQVISTEGGKQVIKTVAVTTGGTDGINTEITSGLTEGETIIEAGGPSQSQGGGGRGPSNPFGPQSSGGKRSSS